MAETSSICYFARSSFGADIFFDDQARHCESARQHVATGYVPHGIVNK
jgi:5'-nucleotidase